MACIYGLVSTKNADVIRYIGVSKHDEPSARLSKHYEHAVSSSLNRPIYDWMRKHLSDGYSINAVVLTVVALEDAATEEQRYIAEYKQSGHELLNLTNGGEGVSGYVHSDVSKQKMRDAWSRRKSRSSGKHSTLSTEHRAKISTSMTGRKQHSDHTRKIVESRRLNKKQRETQE